MCAYRLTQLELQELEAENLDLKNYAEHLLEMLIRLKDTLWLNQKLIAKLFNTTKQNVSLHLSNIFKEGELIQDSVVKEFLTTATDGKNYRTTFYNLKAIIAVGFRVNSERAMKFRIWSANTLEEYMSDFDIEIKKVLGKKL